MAQHDYNIANQGFPAFRTDLNNALSAIQTTNSGTSRPTGAVAGQLWLDTTSATTPTLKYYDGADDISLATIDHSANTVNWLDSTVSVTGLTTTATGTVLTLSDSANTSTVNLIIDNDKEIRFREATANGTNYISLSAPASLSADVTYTLPVAPTANNQALISSTAGAMSFTPYSLPATDGTANQILKTDGSGVLSFATPSGGGFSGATTTSSAVDITLTNTSTQVQNVSMTSADKAVILPDATTLTTKGFPAFVIINDGLYPFDVKNNSGNSLLTIFPANSVELNLISNSTSNGLWAKEDAPINITSTPFTTVKTGTSGVPELIFSYGEFKLDGISASKISSTEALITYHAGTSKRDIYGVVVSYSGTTITVNSETLLYSGTSTASINSQGLMLSATNGFLFVQRASNHVVVPFTISGTTITAGTASSTFGVGTSLQASLGVAIAMTSTEALLPVRDNSATTTFVLRNIIHNGASAPTLGTASSAITVLRGDVLNQMSKIDSTNAFIRYSGASTYSVARVVTISGASAPTLQTANTSATESFSDNAFNTNIFPVSSTEFIVLGQFGSENYTVSGTTVTYVGAERHSVLNSSQTDEIHGQSVAKPLIFGNNIITVGRQVNAFHIRAKLGNFFHIKQKGITLSKIFFTSTTGSSQAFATETLDSTTGIAVTNNYGTTTISATIIKYVGA
jgi:hypothetical protein